MKKLNKDQIEIVNNCGAFGYSYEKMANVLEQPVDEIQQAMSDETSQIYKTYKAGKDKADYVIDKKLFELALTGDLQALEEFESRKDIRNE